MMSRGLGLVLGCVVALGACTTISTGPRAITLMEQQQAFPIKIMADALVERFSNRGWAMKVDPAKQANKLVSFLSRGWAKTETKPEADVVDTYLAALADDPARALSVHLLSQISLATTEAKNLNNHVNMFAVQPMSEDILRVEMLSLEQAVLAALLAKKLFTSAVKRADLADASLQSGLLELDAQIAELTNQTNAINQRRQSTATG
ncbi:MAG: hypothetical protein JKX99_01160 [Robiginitomaculum sp.]|nr:hypothetical protein [Robiginitomaculum sp.]